MNLYTKKEAKYCNNPKKGKRNARKLVWNIVIYQIDYIGHVERNLS